jgi:uncharacterized protein (TIGR03083 family)
MVDVDYSATLLEQSRLLGELVFDADPSMPVPTCPGWSLLQLLRHVGRGDRWAAQIVSDRASTALDPRLVRDGRPPDDVEGARVWFEASPHTVVDAVAACAPDVAVWTFLGPRPAAWWVRRRLHEATVHRADVALATSVSYQLDPDIAADGISEWLERLTVELATAHSLALAPGRSMALDPTDLPGAWLIRGATPGISWERATAGEQVDLRLAGPTTELFLSLVRRRPVVAKDRAIVSLDGDVAVWDAWLAATPF